MTKPFVMPGADTPEDEPTEKLDMSFTAKEEEKVEDKVEDEAKVDDEKVEDEAKVDDEKVEDEAKVDESKAKTDEEDEEEAAEAARLEAERAAANKGKKQPMVPKSRLDEVLAKNRVMQEEIDRRRAAEAAAQPKEAPKEFDFDAREKDYMQAIRDGDDVKALSIRKEIRAAEQTQNTQAATKAGNRNADADALMRAAAEVEASFPQFKQGHADFNEAATTEVVALRDAFIIQGKNPVEALNRAVKIVIADYGFDTPAPKDDTKVVDLKAKRDADAQKKKTDAAAKQPNSIKGESNRSTPKADEADEIDKLSDEEFNALPDATRRRMRGDFM